MPINTTTTTNLQPVQSSSESAARVGENLLAAQSVHVDEAFRSLYVPGVHSVHDAAPAQDPGGVSADFRAFPT